jgi:hypothetical protein
MAKVKTRWMQENSSWTLEQEHVFENDDFNDLIQEIRGFSRELQAENDLAEERADERARQRISIREV